MEPERDVAAATPAPEPSQRTSVQQAVEQFVELHSCGEAPDLTAFAARFPTDLQPQILAQCREFLAFDGLLGHQPWHDGAPTTKATASPGEGRAFGDFIIQEELGRGGMGVVYLANQKSLNRRVALKVMASGLTLSKRHVERFRREAAAAAQLRHPAIVAVHSLTEVDGTFALAMDYVAGRNLADILDDLRLANGDEPTTVDGTLGLAKEKGYVAECAMLVAELASGLAAAHQAGVVHRDLKPRNLMLDDRRQVRLLDFGLAKSLGEGSISMSGEITGTAHYMSPEQTLAKRVEVDHRADIWALGVILYELLTLRRPFDGKNLQQIVYEICFKEPPPLQRRNHKVPRDLVTICQKALEKDPQNRYQTAAEFEADLLRFLRWEPIHAQPAGAMTRLAKWARRHRTETVIAAVLVLGGLAAGVFAWQRGQQADRLLVQAEQAAADKHFGEAFTLTDQALALRNDGPTRARLQAYAQLQSEAGKRIEAEASSLMAKSREQIERDRELAIVLALAAEHRLSTAATRSTVLAALGSGQVVRNLQCDSDTAGPGGLRSIRCGPDSRTIATSGYDDGAIRLWDTETGALRATLRGHVPKVPVVTVAFAGDVLWSVSADKTLRSWRLPDGQPLRMLPLAGAAAQMQLDRRGDRALLLTNLSLNGPYLAQAWDLHRGTPLAEPIVHEQVPVASAFSRCGMLAATSCAELGTLRLWRAGDGAPVPLRLEPRPKSRVRALEFAPDSSLLAVAVDQTVHFYDCRTGALRASCAHSREVTAMAFDSKGQRLLTGSRDATARVWQLRGVGDGEEVLAPREQATLVGHAEVVQRVAFDATDQLALTATANQAGELRVFDVAAGRTAAGTAVQRLEVGPSIESAEFAPDGRSVVAIAGRRRALAWDLGTGRGVVTLRQPGEVPATTFDATGDRLFTAGDDRRLRAWSARDGRLLWGTEPFAKPLQRLALTGSGTALASSTTDGGLHVVRVADGGGAERVGDHGGTVVLLCYRDNDRELLSAGARGDGGGGGAVRLTTLGDPQPPRELLRPLPIVAGDMAADGSMLATIERDESVVRLWSLPDFAPRGELSSGTARLGSVQFAPDGKALLVAARDGNARIHSLDGTVVVTFPGEPSLAFARFARDGLHVLTGGANVRLWRVADGSERLYFRGHRASVLDAAWSQDGAWVATCAGDGTTCVWPTDPVLAARRLPLRTPTSTERRAHGLPEADDR